MELPISAQLLSSSYSSSFSSKFPETRVGISKATLFPFLSHKQPLFSPYLRQGLSPIHCHLTALPRASIGETNGSPVTSSPTNTGGRIGEVKRVTKETNVSVRINLDGSGVADSSTGIPFLDHMLDQLASHGLFDVHVKATGDTHIDDHHTNEDTALAIGTELPTNPKTLDGEGWMDYAIVNAIDKLQFRCNNVALPCSQETSSLRRHVLACGTVLMTSAFNYGQLRLFARAGAVAGAGDEEDMDEGVLGAVKSLFDPNEKTKSGKVLPKAYLKSAREVVKTLRESLKEDPKDVTKFRRTADAAKESIREYLSGWRGQKPVINEESYVMLEKAIRSLASFYSKAGPSAPLPEVVKSEILNDLKTAEEFL
ncbi:uncharacterized protein LOC127800183 [Diospyros lotus]|uniref:uncharacterized protein LOC127800183 n=1 Tax=Diospyros lotus TaxID=55363 RepID=UPI0022590A1D|nr:uncharacterized protein LOC127800183 [Diospyros lotus]